LNWHIASVSFGKDSLAMLIGLIERRLPLDEVLFYDTGMEFETTYRMRDRMLPLLRREGILYTELRPRREFLYMMLEKPVKGKNGFHYGYSWCGGPCRWGTGEKIRATDAYAEARGATVYVGIAADEHKRLAKKHKQYNRYVPLFDISQTGELEDFEGEAVPYAPLDMTPRHRQNIVAFNQDVPGFGELMAVLQSVSPLPISFSAEITQDGILLGSDIIIQTGITQLRAVRAALTQIVHAMLHTRCSDKALKAAEAESVVYVVSQRLGLETAGLRFQRIGDFGASREKNEKKAFLDTVQKTAMFLTDSIEGEQEARRLGYDTADFYMLLAGKTASRLLRAGHRVWLVDPDTLGGKWAASAKEIEDHNGPFAVERAEWHNATGRAA